MAIKNIEGKTFGRLTVLRRGNKNKWNNYQWECICSCGKQVSVAGGHLISGHSMSCSCLSVDNLKKRVTKHNKCNTKTYKSWARALSRCNNPRDTSYRNYGARGIEVCARWKSFECFYKDMGERPEGKSLDRIDNNGNYERGNCRWSTQSEQCRNTRKNTRLTYKGTTRLLLEWAELYGIAAATLRDRVRRYKWPIEKALEQPVRDRGR